MLYNRFIFRDVFQFHKGTIKTKELLTHTTHDIAISIP